MCFHTPPPGSRMLGLRPMSKIASACAVRAHFPTAPGISLIQACTLREITQIFYAIPLYKSMGLNFFLVRTNLRRKRGDRPRLTPPARAAGRASNNRFPDPLFNRITSGVFSAEQLISASGAARPRQTTFSMFHPGSKRNRGGFAFSETKTGTPPTDASSERGEWSVVIFRRLERRS